MNNISSFLSRFRNILLSSDNIKEKTSQVISEKLNIKIDPENVKFSGGVLNIKSSPLAKSEIFMKKEKIIAEINSLLEKDLIKDIR